MTNEATGKADYTAAALEVSNRKLEHANERIVEFEDIKKGHLALVEQLRAQLAQVAKERDEARDSRDHWLKMVSIQDALIKANGMGTLQSERDRLARAVEVARKEFADIKKEAGLNCYHIMQDYGTQAAQALKRIEHWSGMAIADLAELDKILGKGEGGDA